MESIRSLLIKSFHVNAHHTALEVDGKSITYAELGTLVKELIYVLGFDSSIKQYSRAL